MLAEKIISYEKDRNMRLLFLRSPDPVLNFWNGITRCPHARAPESGLAKDCLSCLRNLVAKNAVAKPKLPPGSPVACIVSELKDGMVNWAISVRHTKLDQW